MIPLILGSKCETTKKMHITKQSRRDAILLSTATVVARVQRSPLTHTNARTSTPAACRAPTIVYDDDTTAAPPNTFHHFLIDRHKKKPQLHATDPPRISCFTPAQKISHSQQFWAVGAGGLRRRRRRQRRARVRTLETQVHD